MFYVQLNTDYSTILYAILSIILLYIFYHQKYDMDILYSSSIWGPTCDGLDCILQECKLPELRSGDWIYFRDMGAYTIASASGFNGMPPPRQYFVCAVGLW